MNILLLSCHLILEHNLLKLWTELGYQCFSYGAYQVGNGGNGIRPEIPNLYQNSHLKAVSVQSSQNDIHPEILEWADVIVSMHRPDWIESNWNKVKKAKKPFIYYSIGQSSPSVEKVLAKYRKEGLVIVRYSPKEETIPGYVGSDALIRFHADPTELDGYVGQIPRIVNVSQALFGNDKVRSRGDHMNLPEFKQVVEGLDWKVFGPDNENAGEHNGGLLDPEDLKQMMRFNRAFFYTGTRPASYTLAFMDAFMIGMPIVAIGPKLGNTVYTTQQTYEVHEIIGTNGDAGFWSDDIQELKKYCKMLLEDHDLAKQIGARGRQRAVQFFGKDRIKSEWEAFFKSL